MAPKIKEANSKKEEVKDGKISKNSSLSKRAGLVFPVARIHSYMKRQKIAPRCSHGAAIYLAAAIEYLVAEIMEISGDAAKSNKKTRITREWFEVKIFNIELI